MNLRFLPSLVLASLLTSRLAAATPSVNFSSSVYLTTENASSAAVQVLLSDPAGEEVTVDFLTLDLLSSPAAKAGEDYTSTATNLTFLPGQTNASVVIPLLGDSLPEASERFEIVLSNVTGSAFLGSLQRAKVWLLDMTDVAPHQLTGLKVLDNQQLQMSIATTTSARFADHFDLFPIETSSDLIQWTPWQTVLRTNASTNAIDLAAATVAAGDRLFYRTPEAPCITPFPRPPGDFPVGVKSRLVTDPSRKGRYGISTNCSFMVSIWYPAVAEAGQRFAQAEDPPIALDTAWGTRWGARHFMDRQPFFVSHAIPDALCRATQSPYPILLYSPSFTGIRTEVADLGPYLASCGYVVVAMDHFDAYGTVFPDGSYLRTNIASSSAEGTRDRIRDVFFVLDELARWNESDPDFASRLDLGRVATMGYSWGGEVAGESACTSSRIHAAIIVDCPLNSWAAPVLVASGLSKPCLLMGGTFLSAHQSLFNRLTRDAVSVQFSVADHNMYCDQYWLFANYNLPTGREIARTLHAYARWFLDRHFKGSTDPIPAAAGFPKLNAVTQK